ncbi:unnamed protein product [Rotaria socialis]|uniref:Uncharacterized protein n=1 Tax=Rotaria socialis TaxID=392032 RepID=A0A818JI58_9BILA|nr:unnamed protein product [Rotaria socialis]CAF4405913.1 unnamed protein product [Rotaria socialis]
MIMQRLGSAYCCSCTPLCIFFSLLAVLLIAAGIAGLIIALIKPTTSTTSPAVVVITRSGDPIVGIYSTTAGGPTGASNGRYSNPGEMPPEAIDGLSSTKCLNFGVQGSPSAVLLGPGVGTSFYATPAIRRASVEKGLLFASANDFPTRDPITVTLEIYSGPTGINPVAAPARSTYMLQQTFSNTIAFSSYRLLVTSQRSLSDAVQYAEAEILGYI